MGSSTNTKTEFYDLRLEDRNFEIHYVHTTMESMGTVTSIDDHAILYELLQNMYETPKQGNFPVAAVASKGRQIKRETIRSVMRGLSSPPPYCVEIQQWREIPAGLEALIEELPDHVKKLLQTEYSDPNVLAYDFGYPAE